jgi:hypothetical protein
VILKQYGAAVPHLSKALAWVSSDHEGAYYLGLALEADGLEANGDDRGARIQWEFAQQSRGYHAPAMMSLAALAARGGDRAGALAMVQEVLSNRPRLTRARAAWRSHSCARFAARLTPSNVYWSGDVRIRQVRSLRTKPCDWATAIRICWRTSLPSRAYRRNCFRLHASRSR